MRRILSAILVFAVVLTWLPAVPLAVHAETSASGTCGDNLTWTLDEGGTLTISGTGAVKNYAYDSQAPWYAYKESIFTVDIQSGVTSIGDYAFYSCDSLTSVSISDSVTSIGDFAFCFCIGLTSVTIPASVTSIGSSAFYNCIRLTTVNFSATNCTTMASSGSPVFSGCENLTTVNIGSNVTRIPSYAFYGCTGLTSMTIPDSVTSIGSGAFYDCTGLTSITISDSVTSIGDRSFAGCYGLTSVTIGSSVTTIGNYAFSGCHRLTSVIIPDSVTGIGDRAFYDCTGLTSVTIPDSVTSIGDYAFSGCAGLTWVNIPNSVIYIGSGAFHSCSRLATVTIGGNVSHIGDLVFFGCNLTGIWVSDDNPNYSNDQSGVLFDKNKTTLVMAPEDISGSYDIPASVTSIDNYAFYYCTSLTEITIPGGVTTIGERAFHQCTTLAEVHYGGTATQWDTITIGKSNAPLLAATLHTAGLVNGTCGDNLAWILDNDGMLTISGTGAMTDYTSNLRASWYDYRNQIDAVVIQSGVTSIGDYAFYECTGLTSVAIPDSVTGIGDYAFYECTGLTSVAIPDSVTGIGEYVFYKCTSLTSVTIPASVTSIGNYAFYDCIGLTEITVPGSVTSIGYAAFSGCSKLADVYYDGTTAQWNNITNGTYYGNTTLHTTAVASGTCGDNLTWILDHDGTLTISGTGAMREYTSAPHVPWYAYQKSILTVDIQSGVTSIGDCAFYNCTGLTSVTIPDSVTDIGEDAFYKCSGLTSITIPDSVTSIGDYVFYNCDSLTSVTIPDGVISIGENAFYKCYSLTSITIPDSVTSIGEDAFYDCYRLTTVTIGSSITSIGYAAFDECDKLADVYYNGTTMQWRAISIGRYNAPLLDATLHTTAVARGTCGDNLTWILDNDGTLTFFGVGAMTNYTSDSKAPWYACSSRIATVIIPDGVTSIGDYAFYNCNNLTSVAIPASVTTIGDYAFQDCNGLTSMAIPDGVTSIGEDAFWNCNSLTSVTIPASVTSVGDRAFSCCGGLTGIWVSDSNPNYSNDKSGVLFNKNKTILIQMPGGRSGSYSIPTSVTGIGDYAFYDCDSLTSVYIPSSVTSIGDCGFAGCYGLPSVYIPSSVKSIGNGAFSGCYGLTSVTIPVSVTSMGDGAFAGCYGLTSVKIPSSVKSIGDYAFDYCTSLTSVTIPNSVTSIGYYAFASCINLTSVTIPASVISIGEGAFFDCTSLTSVTVGKNVTSIGNDAFRHCVGLTSVTIPVSVTSIGQDAFDECSMLTDVYYGGTVEQWKAISIGEPNDILLNAALHTTEVIRGTCGDNLTWTLDEKGKLTISGTGAMTDYTYDSEAPWSDYRNLINTVVIQYGATSIGNYAFCNCYRSTSVTIPASVTSIGEGAFAGCSGLTSVTIGNKVTSIGDYAFYDCDGLTSVTIPVSVTSIGEYTFYDCDYLTYVTIGNGVTSIGDCAFSDCGYLTYIEFQGNAPSFGSDVFQDVYAVAYYPANRTGWTEDLCQDYGGFVDWKAYCIGNHTQVMDPAVDATCTMEGKTAGRHCSACGQVFVAQETIPAKGHKHTTAVTAPTCTEKGYTTHICSVCGDTYTDSEKDALGHDMSRWETFQDAACTEYGSKRRDCSRCDYFEIEVGHKHTAVVTAPTCTEDGYTTYTCACGDSYTADPVAKLGHDMSRWETFQDAACTEYGSRRRDCSRCDYFEIEVGHKHTAVVTAPTCTTDGYTTYTCSCGDTYTANPVTKLGHDWGQWYEVTAATPDQDGQERRDCSRCDHYETQTLIYQGNGLKLPGEHFAECSTVWIEGLPYAIQGQGDDRFVVPPAQEEFYMVTYTYFAGDGQDVHTQYPTGMKVYLVSNGEVTYIPELDNLLQYSGSSIRIAGKKGIRMITALTKDNKKALTGNGLAGFTLQEYGTALCFASEIQEGDALILGREFTRSNYAYKKDVNDPVFASPGNLIQYTNVLVGFTQDQCKEDIAMRPYIILKDGQGNQITLYGGTIYRSIGYIAYQNRTVFQPKTNAYNFVWEIIHHVYGDQYDADYKG